MLMPVTSKETMDSWHNDPDKLVAFITKLFWDARIDPDEPLFWLAKDGVITISDHISSLSGAVEKNKEAKL